MNAAVKHLHGFLDKKIFVIKEEKCGLCQRDAKIYCSVFDLQ